MIAVKITDVPDGQWAVSWENQENSISNNFFWTFRTVNLIEFLTEECGVWEFDISILLVGGSHDVYRVSRDMTAQSKNENNVALNEYIKTYFVVDAIAVATREQAERIRKNLEQRIILNALKGKYD